MDLWRDRYSVPPPLSMPPVVLIVVGVVFGAVRLENIFAYVARFPAQAALRMHGYPAARSRQCDRWMGEDVRVHVSHRRHDVLQREFGVSAAGVPHELVLRRRAVRIISIK